MLKAPAIREKRDAAYGLLRHAEQQLIEDVVDVYVANDGLVEAELDENGEPVNSWFEYDEIKDDVSENKVNTLDTAAERLMTARADVARLEKLLAVAEARDLVVQPPDDRFLDAELLTRNQYADLLETRAEIRQALIDAGKDYLLDLEQLQAMAYASAQEYAKQILAQIGMNRGNGGGKYGTTGAFSIVCKREIMCASPFFLVKWLYDLADSPFVNEKHKAAILADIKFGAKVVDAVEHDEYQTAFGPAPALVAKKYSASFTESKLIKEEE